MPRKESKTGFFQFLMPGFNDSDLIPKEKELQREPSGQKETPSIDPVPVGKQRGFFVSDTGELHLAPKKGDHMIKPREKKKKKGRKNETENPFAEVMRYRQAQADISDQVGDHTYETVNAGIKKVRVGRHAIENSTSGEPGLQFRHEGPRAPKLPLLSPKARALKRALEIKEAERVEELRNKK